MTTKYDYSAQSFNRSLSEHIWVICRQRPRGQDVQSRDVIARHGKRKWCHVARWLRGCRRQLFLVVAPQRSGTRSCFHSLRLACKRKISRATLLTHKNTPVTRYFRCILSSSRLPLLTMETCTNSHKKQKLSNAAENWVSVATSSCFNASISHFSSWSSHQWAKVLTIKVLLISLTDLSFRRTSSVVSCVDCV